jgi:hypothetical protein
VIHLLIKKHLMNPKVREAAFIAAQVSEHEKVVRMHEEQIKESQAHKQQYRSLILVVGQEALKGDRMDPNGMKAQLTKVADFVKRAGDSRAAYNANYMAFCEKNDPERAKEARKNFAEEAPKCAENSKILEDWKKSTVSRMEDMTQ